LQNQQGCPISAAVITKPLQGIIRPSNLAKIASPRTSERALIYLLTGSWRVDNNGDFGALQAWAIGLLDQYATCAVRHTTTAQT
jgi:hypothetical protein